MAKEIDRTNSGRKNSQKMKPYLVYQYLLRETDENHVKSAPEIVAFLQSIGVEAERRSIYKDIDAINDALWLLENHTEEDEEYPLEYAVDDAKEEGTYEKAIEYKERINYSCKKIFILI